MALQNVGAHAAGCQVSVGVWTIVTCIGVVLAGLLTIIGFIAWRWRRSTRTNGKPLRLGSDPTIRGMNGLGGISIDGQLIQLCSSYASSSPQLHSDHLCSTYKLCSPRHVSGYDPRSCDDFSFTGTHPPHHPLLHTHTYIPQVPEYSPMHISSSPHTPARIPGSPRNQRTMLSGTLQGNLNDWRYPDECETPQHWYSTIDNGGYHDIHVSDKVPSSNIKPSAPPRVPPSPRLISNNRQQSSPVIPPSPGRTQLKPPPSPLMSSSTSTCQSGSSITPPSSPSFSVSHQGRRIPITYI